MEGDKMQTILKLKVGEIFKDGEAHPVFKTFWKKTSKKGETYYESKDVLFIKEVATNPKEEDVKL